LWRHPDQPDGVLYRSRLDPDVKCVALYDRARSKILFDIPPVTLWRHPDRNRWLARYKLGLRRGVEEEEPD
jgi:hypothetical protein